MAVKRKVAKRSAARVKAPKLVTMLLNGNTTGTVDPTGKTIAEVGAQIAKDHGLKSFSILVNGIKVPDAGASKPLAGAQTIEVFAKETRG